MKALFISVLLALAFPILAQDVNQIKFGGGKYDNKPGCDSITLYLKLTESNGNRIEDIVPSDLKNHFTFVENKDTIPNKKWKASLLTGGQRIPDDFTISVLVDLSIPESGKEDIYKAVKTLVDMASDSSVYLSFFGDQVSNSRLVNKNNYSEFHGRFMDMANNKFFYSALYAKLTEFNHGEAQYVDQIKSSGYKKVGKICERAEKSVEKEENNNLLFIFTGGNENPQNEELNFTQIVEYFDAALILPRVYAFYYVAENQMDEDVERVLKAVTRPQNSDHELRAESKGDYKPSNNIDAVVSGFQQVVRNEMYDFALTYQVGENKKYTGRVDYTALWDGEAKGAGTFSVGAEEDPWPKRHETAGDSAKKYLVALLVAFLTCLLFIAIMKIIVPGVKSAIFSAKYHKKYKIVENVRTLVCPLCRCEILPGQRVVNRCRHIMHVKCWKANGFKCVEYGQNCKEGIQDHVHWESLFSKETLMDCFLTIMGICASLVSWVIYEVTGRGFFGDFAKHFVNAFFKTDGEVVGIVESCVTKVSSFLTIGLLLGFFLSFTFRFFDGAKRRDFKWFLEITGLSLLSGVIGMAAFTLGSVVLCLWVSPADSFIPSYCSFPAYLLFSVCISLSLIIRSTIPFKSAFLGGLVSAIIGFIVLYFSDKMQYFSARNNSRPWMTMLLNFVIYGGGLGASLLTVRMLAEKYFLIVKNGIRSGLRIPIHKWMNAGNMVTIGMTQQCEIQMAWEKSNKVAKEHVQLYVDQSRSQAMLRPMAPTTFNLRAELGASNKPVPLFNGDTFKIGDTIFEYVEN